MCVLRINPAVIVILGLLLLLGVLLVAGGALARGSGGVPPAAPNAAYDLSWWTVDGGGYTWSTGEGERYTLGGTAGQPDAGVTSGDGYLLQGGFWPGGALSLSYRIYLPLVVRGA